MFDQGQFAKEVLPKYFKHNNMASFVRQLNMCEYPPSEWGRDRGPPQGSGQPCQGWKVDHRQQDPSTLTRSVVKDGATRF